MICLFHRNGKILVWKIINFNQTRNSKLLVNLTFRKTECLIAQLRTRFRQKVFDSKHVLKVYFKPKCFFTILLWACWTQNPPLKWKNLKSHVYFRLIKLTLKVRFWHFLSTPHHNVNSQNEIISFEDIDRVYLWLTKLTLRILIFGQKPFWFWKFDSPYYHIPYYAAQLQHSSKNSAVVNFIVKW